MILGLSERDPQAALKRIEETEAKVKSNDEAVLLCKVLEGQIRLKKLNQITETKVRSIGNILKIRVKILK